MSARRRRWKAGSVVEVPLGDGWHTYAWLRKDPLISVLDARSMEDLAPAGIVARPVLFSVWVMGRALALWPEVGTIELPGELERNPEFVKRDLISGKITVISMAASVQLPQRKPSPLKSQLCGNPSTLPTARATTFGACRTCGRKVCGILC